ncbi:MAG: signal recognition particle-docking protein FtsY [Clostridia bacterium]|nr:signal recognition particle-docking protein FtsY [Clostridia bacterium]
MGFFDKIKQGLQKTKQAIGFHLKKLFKVGIFNDDFYDEMTDVLISADVGSATTDEIIESLKEKIEENSITDEQSAVDALKEVLLDILGDSTMQLTTPTIITVVGVNGVGKTTTIGKLANFYANQGKSVLVAAADTFRAAAGEQLDVWANRANVRIIKQPEGSDPAAVVFDAINSAKSKGNDVIFVDTAGRLHNKKNLMEELKKISRVIDREYPQAQKINLLVIDATTGQNALNQCEIFDEAVDLDGIVLTKLDGTAKGGIVFSINSQQGLPVYFVGVGEGIDDLVPFDKNAFVEGLI